MALIPISPNMPQEQLVSAISQNFNEINQRLYVSQVIKDETGTPRIILGRLPDGTYGLVISKVGQSVLDVFS